MDVDTAVHCEENKQSDLAGGVLLANAKLGIIESTLRETCSTLEERGKEQCENAVASMRLAIQLHEERVLQDIRSLSDVLCERIECSCNATNTHLSDEISSVERNIAGRLDSLNNLVESSYGQLQARVADLERRHRMLLVWSIFIQVLSAVALGLLVFSTK